MFFQNIDINKGAQAVCAEFIDKLEDLSKKLRLTTKIKRS